MNDISFVLAVHDPERTTADPWSLYFYDYTSNEYYCYTCSDQPQHPQGVGQLAASELDTYDVFNHIETSHLKVQHIINDSSNLPEPLQRFVSAVIDQEIVKTEQAVDYIDKNFPDFYGFVGRFGGDLASNAWPMTLHMVHGRCNPDQDMDDWGFEGPTLFGVSSYYVTYNTTFRLQFETEEIAKFYQEITGWCFWDPATATLEVSMRDDMIHIPACDAFFGDWDVLLRDGV